MNDILNGGDVGKLERAMCAVLTMGKIDLGKIRRSVAQT